MPIMILDPRTHADASEGLVMVERPASLSGQRIGLLDNTKNNARRVLEFVAANISKEYPTAQFTYSVKKSSSTSLSPELLGDLKRTCDVVIAGIGD